MPHSNESQRRGREFEEYVASLYRALGYRVEQNVAVFGQQVDLIAERSVPGLGRVKTLIECKFRSSKSITNQEVQDFNAMYEGLRHPGGFSIGVMVANVGFSKDARAIASGTPAVQLLSIAELEKRIFSLDESLHAIVSAYEAMDIYKRYVPISGRGSFPSGGNERRLMRDLEAETLAWIKDARPGLLTVLADFGGGKTTFLQRLRYQCAREYLHGQGGKIPVLFNLKEMRRSETFDGFILETLSREFCRSVHLELFWSYAAAGNFVLLLDGLDEVSALADQDLRRRYVTQLARLYNAGSITLLTCRPAYFVSEDEYRTLLADTTVTLDAHKQPSQELVAIVDKTIRSKELRRYLRGRLVEKAPRAILPPRATISIVELNLDQIDIYLKSFEAEFQSMIKRDWLEVRSLLERVYDVRDLMARPILLNMIVESILSGRIDINDEQLTIGPASLYDVYTSMQFDLEWHKGESRRLFSAKERRLLAELIACKMGTEGRLEVRYEEVLEIASLAPEHLGLSTKLAGMTAEQVASDIQVCTFLTRDYDDLFRFTHKSFMEFFYARHLKRQIEAGGEGEGLQTDWPIEITYFLGSFANLSGQLVDAIERLLVQHEDATESRLRSNLISVLLFGGPELFNVKIKFGTVRNLECPPLRFVRSELESITFDSVSWDGLVFDDTKIRMLGFRKCAFDTLEFRAVVGADLWCERCSVERLLIAADAVLFLQSAGLTVEYLVVENALLYFRGLLHAAGGYVNRSVLHFVDEGSMIALGSLIVSGSIVSCALPPAPGRIIDWGESHFSNCIIYWVTVREEDLERMLLRRSLEDCRGVMLVLLKEEGESEVEGEVASERKLRVATKMNGYTWLGGLLLVNYQSYASEVECRLRVHHLVASKFGTVAPEFAGSAGDAG
jgi:hypothetical protein